jgi:hypothetical protein
VRLALPKAQAECILRVPNGIGVAQAGGAIPRASEDEAAGEEGSVVGTHIEDNLDQSVCRLIWDNISRFMPLGDFPTWGDSGRSTIVDTLTRFMESRGFRDARFWDSNYLVRYDVTPDAAKVLVALMRDEYEEDEPRTGVRKT